MGYLFTEGGAGDPPAPPGDPPGGRGRDAWLRDYRIVPFNASVPLGGSPDGTGESPVLPTVNTYRMGEGEPCPARLRIQPLWKLQAMCQGVPSPVGRERVRVRVNLFELRLLLGTYFCTNP